MTKKPSRWTKIQSGLNGKTLGIYGGIILLDHLLWNTIIIYPLKILTVFFHELSHALAAIATGGEVREIVLVPEQGGHCLIAGGNGFLVYSAGYLGSLIWGGIILMSAANSKRDKQIMIGLGAILIAVSFIWIRPFISFGFIFCIILGGVMMASGNYLPTKVNDWVLRIIGLTSCLYATLDVKDDTIDRNLQESDAGRLAEITGMPSLFWGYFWMALAILGTILFILLASMAQVKAKGNTEGTSPS